MHSGFNQMLRVAVRKEAGSHGRPARLDRGVEIPRPTHDKFFRVIIKVSLVERRRIHRVEELLD